jgi:ATP-dependent protease ClpP protease subunit
MASFHDDEMAVQYLATDDSIDIFLHGIIGDEYTQTDSLSVAQLLASHKGKPVNLRVNSPGGLAYDGVAMFNAIDAHDGPTTGIIEGMAGSAASLAVIACDTVKCYSTAVFHPHYSLIMAMGHQADIREALAIQEVLDADLEEVYAEASGRSVAEVKADLLGPNGDGTRMNASAALAAGYVDEIIGHKKQKQAATIGGNSAALAIRQKRLRALMAKTT